MAALRPPWRAPTPMTAGIATRAVAPWRLAAPLDRRLELHLLERRAAGELERIGERLHHFEVVVAVGDDELHALAGFPERVASHKLLQVRRVFRLVVGRVERRLVVIAEHFRSVGKRAACSERRSGAREKSPSFHAPSSKIQPWPR